MKTLVDSSVWISHFKKSDLKLIKLLEYNEAVLHPFVIQELYLGRPKGKDFIFERLAKLPQLKFLTDIEYLDFVDQFKIPGKGIGVVDTHLLGAAYLNRINLYTFDKNLKKISKQIL